MTAPTGKVLARREGDEISFLVVGHVTCHHSPAMRQYAEDAHAAGATSVEIDLRDCCYGDSTFLGTLLALKRRFDPQDKGQFRFACPSPAFRQMLKQIGAERLFTIVDHASSTDMQTTWQQLTSDIDRAQSARFKHNVVEAHLELAKSGGELAQRFGPLAEAAARELNDSR
jgi:anti-anti-sigma regulatory factor